MRRIYLFVILCFAAGIVSGQTKRAFIKAAEKAEQNKNHYAALTYYGEVLEFDHKDAEINYKYAEAARKFNAYDIAAKHYALLVDTLVADSFPLSAFYLAEMKQRMGQYDEALIYYNMYLAEYSDTDEHFTQKATEGIENSEWAVERQANPDKSAEMIDMDSGVNTPYSDFGAIMKDDVLYYSSLQHEEKVGEAFPPRAISKLHKLEEEDISLLDGVVNDTDRLVAHTTFNKDGSMMYYNICEYLNEEDIRCDIYRQAILEDGTYGGQEKLSNAVNIDSFTNTQPHMAYDVTSDQEILYFVSDREGGKGKLDIYYSIMNGDGAFSEAKNMEHLNTPENDVTPYFNNKTNKFYFSSDGRQGLGGYDIYFTEKSTDGTLGDISSLRPPVNSSYHDLYYTVDGLEDAAYFSSNREGAAYVDPTKKACCFDIYNVVYDEVIIDLDALTYDALTKDPLYNATVHLVDVATGDTLLTVTSPSDSSHIFQLRRDRDYLLIAEREHYNTMTVPLSTRDVTKSVELKERIYMTTDKMQLDVFTFNERTKKELAGVTLRVVDISDPNNPIYLTTNELSNDFHVYLPLGKKYRLEAVKFGFVTEVTEVDLAEVTEPGLMREDMYLEVFDIEDYMPVTVYFDNDYPNPKSKSTLSQDEYRDLYANYILQKPTYIRKVARKLNKNIKSEAQRDIAGFFEGDIVGGYEKMKRFMRALKKELGLGRSLEIAIKGYTSPLAETKYNLALGQRRVASVKNEILAYEGGLFRPYVENGQLILTDISFGEELAPSDVSDVRSDHIGSVYSVGASRERKVEIVSIRDQ